MSAWMVGIDTGGTFTDLIAVEVESRRLHVIKVPSVPGNPSTAFMNALDTLFRAGVGPEEGSFIAPFYQTPPLLVPQELTAEITERVNFAGEVVTSLDEEEVRRAVRRLRDL